MKYLEAVTSFSIAVILALIVTFVLPEGVKDSSLTEVVLTLLAIAVFCLGIYQIIVVLVSDYNRTL